MRIQLFSCLCLLQFCLILLCIDIVSVSSQCLNDQQSILIQLKNTIKLDPEASTKISSWNQSTDCCSWEGVDCSADGHVTGLDLSNEGISCEMVASLGKLQSLLEIRLSQNNFSCPVPLFLANFKNLTVLELSDCKLKYFPKFDINMSKLEILDLSDNKIGGEIPSWIWKFDSLRHLYLSHNKLESLQEPYVMSNILEVLDLHDNQLHGNVPIPGMITLYVDYSFNHFNVLSDAICTARCMKVLDLSDNYLSGTIPACLSELNGWGILRVLKLGNNNLSGNIPEIFPRDCDLETLDLHGNHLEGKVPESLGYCKELQVLDLGNNLLNDSFPCFLMENCTMMRVLSLRSNKLHGDIQCRGATTVWSKLQIIDIASNYLTGYVPKDFFQNLTAMIEKEDAGQSKSSYLQPTLPRVPFPYYYFDKVTVVIKGNTIELGKILTIFTSIDFSNNRFQGEIPRRIGELKELHILNMAHNAFTGLIPASIGNLKQLDSLDLSLNHLAGRIPSELAGLTLLGFLNLSHNVLEGMIPVDLHYSEDSFEGNKGLCGFQLYIDCDAEHGKESPPPLSEEEGDGKDEINGFLISFEVGIVVGLVTVIAPLVLSRRWSKWYFQQVDRIVVAKIYQHYQRRNLERKNPIRFA